VVDDNNNKNENFNNCVKNIVKESVCKRRPISLIEKESSRKKKVLSAVEVITKPK
jgi:hypothetical protein